MTPIAFQKELNRPMDDLDRFRELAESEIDLTSGGGNQLGHPVYTCTYNTDCQNNDCLTDH